MRIPRNLSGLELAKKLHPLGYQITRQKGSHLRLTTTKNGIHNITIPEHKNLRIGTLANILLSVAEHFKISKEELANKIGI